MVTAYIAGKCSLKCPYCYAWKRLGYNMPMDVMEQLCVWLKGRNVPKLKMWGGEPLEHPTGIKYLLGHARPRQFTITTNGLNLTPDLFDWLVNHSVSVGLSWDGTEESQNSGRQNSYSQLMTVIDDWKTIISKNGGQILKTVASAESLYADVEEIYKAGFERCFLNFFRPYGASYELEDIPALEHEYHRVIKDFNNLPDFALTDVQMYQNIWREQQSNLYVPHCGINAIGIAVGPDGMIYPCDDAVMLGEEFVMGSVWDGVDKEKEKRLRRKLNKLPEKCDNCELKCYPCPVCSVLNTDEIASDPKDWFCELRKMQYRVVNKYLPTNPFRVVK